MKRYLFFICLWMGATSNAQTIRQPLSAIYPAIGAYSKNFADPFSMILNPASLSNIQGAGAGVYGERRFLLSALNQYTAVVALPTTSGNFGLQADYFGYSKYNETQIGFGYGRALGQKVDIGVKFNYYNLQVPAYTSSSTFHFEAGVVLHLSEKLHAGFSVFNPVGGVLSKETDEKIASVFRGGFGYEASDKFFITAEIIKEENKNIGVNAAFQYAFVKQFFFRGGINTLTEQPFAGVGLRVGQMRIDFASNWHPQLGVSPAIMFLFDFKKKETSQE